MPKYAAQRIFTAPVYLTISIERGNRFFPIWKSKAGHRGWRLLWISISKESRNDQHQHKNSSAPQCLVIKLGTNTPEKSRHLKMCSCDLWGSPHRQVNFSKEDMPWIARFISNLAIKSAYSSNLYWLSKNGESQKGRKSIEHSQSNCWSRRLKLIFVNANHVNTREKA